MYCIAIYRAASKLAGIIHLDARTIAFPMNKFPIGFSCFKSSAFTVGNLLDNGEICLYMKSIIRPVLSLEN